MKHIIDFTGNQEAICDMEITQPGFRAITFGDFTFMMTDEQADMMAKKILDHSIAYDWAKDD